MGVSSQVDDGYSAGRGMRLAWGALVVFFVAMYIAPLGVRPIGSPDEVRYGAIAREMLASGDWVSPPFKKSFESRRESSFATWSMVW